MWKFVILALGAFVVGVLVFNFAIMPLLVGHGNVVRVPDLTEMTVPQAERVLKEQGLKLDSVYPVFSPDVPKGCVISQYPAAFTTVKQDRGVRVRVSSGESGVAVPDIRGQSLRHAEIVLGRAGLQLGRISQTFSRNVPRDEVISTFPGPGALVEDGGSVDLLVSSGPAAEEFIMPKLVGESLSAAQRIAESAGLVLEVRPGPSRGSNRIVRQRPEHGTRVTRGTRVEVFVG